MNPLKSTPIQSIANTLMQCAYMQDSHSVKRSSGHLGVYAFSMANQTQGLVNKKKKLHYWDAIPFGNAASREQWNRVAYCLRGQNSIYEGPKVSYFGQP